MADVKERKRVTLHPLKEDGSMDLEINLYPKTLVNGIVDEDGNEVDIATQAKLDDAVNNISTELEEKTTEIADIKQNIFYVESDILAAKQDITSIHEELETKVTEEELNTALAEKQDTLTAGENITIENGVISAVGGISTQELSFSFNGRKNKVVIKNIPEDWLDKLTLSHEGINEDCLLKINDFTAKFYHIDGWSERDESTDSYHIEIYDDSCFIVLICNGDLYNLNNWDIDLSSYFVPETVVLDDTWAPVIVIDKETGEVRYDNIIMPEWLVSNGDLGIRFEVLSAKPAKAWLVTSETNIELVTIFAESAESSDCWIVHIASNAGEYRLTYSNEEDPLPPL